MESISRNLKMKNLLWILIVALILSGFYVLATIHPAYATDGAKVFVDPKDNIYYTSQKGINDTIQINVTIANVTGLAGLEFKIQWNSSILTGMSMTENLFATVTPSGEKSNIWSLAHDVAADSAWYGYTYQNLTRAYVKGYAPINITQAEGYPEGKLVAAIITLNITAEPPSPETFLDSNLDIFVSKPGNMTGGLIAHTVEDGYYKLMAPPVPTPIIAVEPNLYEATYRNETFDVNVSLNNLDASWRVVGVEFKLRYDPALLSIENVTEGPFMKAFAGPPDQGTLFMGPVYGSNYVLVGIVILADENGTWHEPFPSGNGTIVTITFKVLQGPSVSCNLELFDTKLGDLHANPISHTKQSGVFMFEVERLQHNIIVDGATFTVITESNATISPIPLLVYPRQRMLIFNATGADGAVCFVNITIPKNLLWLELTTDNWFVLVDGLEVVPSVGENSTHTWLYFTFITTQKPIQIIGTGVVPEFPVPAILLLLILASTAILLSHRSKFKKPHANNA